MSAPVHSEEFKALIVSLRGRESAAAIAARLWGDPKKRNVVIGIWNRWRIASGEAPDTRRLTPEEREERKQARYEARRIARTKMREIRTTAAAATPINEGQGVTFMDLAPRGCRYPLGGTTEPAQFFCGDVAVDGSSYCCAHYTLCRWQPPRISDTDRERRRLQALRNIVGNARLDVELEAA